MRRYFCPVVVALLLVAGPGQTQIDPLQAAAEAGDLTAQLRLALQLESGDGVVQNYARAAKWYRRAAEAGSLEAANRLGRLHHAGLGVPKDIAKAIVFLEQAAKGGKAEHLFDLAVVLETSDPDEAKLTRAAELYRRASDAGHLDATVSYAVMLQAGSGVTQDFAAAAELYLAAAEAGHPRALNNLGLLYVRGDGVEQDYERAGELFRAAADRGLRQAFSNLGVLYENGFGVEQSDELAAELYRRGGQGDTSVSEPSLVYDVRLAPPVTDEEALVALEKAALAGDPVAEFQYAYLALSIQNGNPRNALRAGLLMRRAAEAGHAPAMANMAVLYFRGQGVPQDFVLGQMWLILAASSGFDGTSAMSAYWNPKMTPDQINDAQARAEAKWKAMREGPK